MDFRIKGLRPWLLILSLSSVHAGETCTAVADGRNGKILVQEGTCDQRLTPASTFKIAISLMGFDSGVLVDEHTPMLPFQKGYPDWIESWKAPTDPQAWMKNSVVWYSQRVTEQLGAERFQRYVRRSGYGNQDLSGNLGRNDGLTHAWLSSSLKISPLEQLTFLGKLVRRELRVSAHAFEMTSRITLIDERPAGWEVHGKTGTGARVNSDGSVDRSRQVGWFVGWATQQGESRLFVHCIDAEVQQPSHYAGPQARDGLVQRLPSLLGFM